MISTYRILQVCFIELYIYELYIGRVRGILGLGGLTKEMKYLCRVLKEGHVWVPAH